MNSTKHIYLKKLGTHPMKRYCQYLLKEANDGDYVLAWCDETGKLRESKTNLLIDESRIELIGRIT